MLAVGEPIARASFAQWFYVMPDTSFVRPSDDVRSLDGNAFVVILDEKTAKWIPTCSEANLFALIACAEADAKTWEDCEVIWPHCRTSEDAVSEINDLPWTTLSLEEVIQSLRDRNHWIAVDLQQCKVVSGPSSPYLYRNGEGSKNVPQESIYLNVAPWWVLQRDVAPNQILDCRTEPPIRVLPHRTGLWGDECIRFFASEMARFVREGIEWTKTTKKGICVGKPELTVEIHRKWLMTPCPAFDDRTPREDLHIAKNWISDLSTNQRYRMEHGLRPVPLPREFSGYETAPMGSHEVILYFEACRTLLASGWFWLIQNPQYQSAADLELRLKETMKEVLLTWLNTAQEDGLSPAEIIQIERERMPLIAPEDQHDESCDCPICDAIASGKFGPSFLFFDGHHLELEDDFAFSLSSTLEEWEHNGGCMGGEILDMDDLDGEDDLDDEDDLDGEDEEDDEDADGEDYFEDFDEEDVEEDAHELASVWQNSSFSMNPVSGHAAKLLTMAFQVAELGAEIQTYNSFDQTRLEVIKQLNTAHRDYQFAMQSENESRDRKAILASRFKAMLETIATDYPKLVSRAADLQSQVDDHMRSLQTRS